MGKTLFFYIFRDLVKIFVLAAVALAGILSFAGLLRPLTERGLGPEQAVRILVWLMPAMASYSIPVAALFATTFVYGRMSADNEAVAAKAAGIAASPAGLLLPATVLASLLGIISTAMVCFLVPAANLQVEQTVWSNLARLAANEINRTSRITFFTDTGRVTVFAQQATRPTEEQLAAARDAALAGVDGDADLLGVSEGVQVVQLRYAYVVRYRDDPGGETLHNGDPAQVPDEVYAAETATVFIDPPAYARGGALERLFDIEGALEQSALSDDQVAITVMLDDGLKFPRRLGLDETGGGQTLVAAARATQFGPIRRDTPVRVNPKFMDVRELQDLLAAPHLARRIVELIGGYARGDQRFGYLTAFSADARGAAGATLAEPGGSTMAFSADGAGAISDGVLTYADTPLRLVQRRPTASGGVEVIEVAATEARVDVEPLSPDADGEPHMLVVFTVPDAAVTIDGRTTVGRSIERRITVPMPQHLAMLPKLTAQDYLQGRAVEFGGTRPTRKFASDLLQKLAQQTGGIVGELHARAAFVVACFVLPLLGAGLGLMFKSGNFLTAFALSTIPAAACILTSLIGSKALEDKPRIGDAELANPALLDPAPELIGLIWSGDAVVAIGAALLLWRLRQR